MSLDGKKKENDETKPSIPKPREGEGSSSIKCPMLNSMKYIHKVVSLINEPNAKRRHLKSAVESVKKVMELSPNSIEFSYFYANLLYELANDVNEYEEVVQECECALAVENPVDHEKQAQEAAEKSKSEIQVSFNRLKALAHEAIKKRDECGRQRDEALHEKEEALRSKESLSKQLEEVMKGKDGLRSEIETSAHMLVYGIEKISGKVNNFKNFSAGGLPKSQKYIGLPSVAYGVIKRTNEIAEEFVKQIQTTAKSRNEARDWVEQRNYEIAIEVSQFEDTISGLREEVEMLKSAFDDCESLLEKTRQLWKKSMINVMAWLRPEVMTSEAKYGFSESLNMEVDLYPVTESETSRPRKRARFDIAEFYEAIKPSKEKPMLKDEIADLLPVLRPYQQRAAYWMIQRENDDLKGHEEWERSMLSSPLCLPVDFLDTSSKMFFNPCCGNLCLHPEPMSPYVNRGILADEMGLGKTVELLACIFSHQKPESEVSSFKDIAAKVTIDEQISLKRLKREPVECICGAVSENHKYKAGFEQSTSRTFSTSAEKDEYEQEIKYLRNIIRTLSERERNLEIELLEYYGLKEQDTIVPEMQNQLKINKIKAELFGHMIESLRAENVRLEARVNDHARVIVDLEDDADNGAWEKKLTKKEKHSRDDVQKMQWEVLEAKIGNWIHFMRIAVKLLFAGERNVCDQMFEGFDSLSDQCFADVTASSISVLLSFGEAIARSKRSLEKFVLLDMYEIMRELHSEIETPFKGKACTDIRESALGLTKRLAQTTQETFGGFEEAVEKYATKTPVPDGTVHPLTSYVINYVKFLFDYQSTLKQLFQEFETDDGTGSQLTSVTMRIMQALQTNLDGKSKQYKDLLGDDWVQRHKRIVQQHANQYKRNVWQKILQCLSIQGLTSSGGGSAVGGGGNSSGVSRASVKDMLLPSCSDCSNIHSATIDSGVSHVQAIDTNASKELATAKFLRKTMTWFRGCREGIREKVAEMPCVATRFSHRRRGMYRVLVEEVEKNLAKLRVKKMGEIEIVVRFSCSSWLSLIQAYGTPMLPRMHYLRPLGPAQQDILRQTAMRIVAARLVRSEPPLGQEVVQFMLDTDTHIWSMRKSKANWFRVVGCLSRAVILARWLDGICTWAHPPTTVLVHALLIAVVMCPQLLLPNVFMYVLILALRFRYRMRVPHNVDLRLSYVDAVGPYELDEEFDGLPTTRSPDTIRLRYDRLRALASRAQTLLGDVAAQGDLRDREIEIRAQITAIQEKDKEMRELIRVQDVSRVDFKLKEENVDVNLKSK